MSTNNQEPKIIFIGTSGFGTIILEELIRGGFKPVLVVTSPDKPVGRKQIITPPPVKNLAQKYKIPILQSEKILNLKSEILNLKPDLIIVAAYGHMLPKDILEIPKYGCLNVHPSLLPRWRGPSPVQFTILEGDDITGVSVIKMAEKMDAGPVVASVEYKIQNTSPTYEELHNKLAEIGGKLLLEVIPKWVSGKITPLMQDESKATFCKILKKEDGLIDWDKPPEYIERQIRAFNPWPGTYTINNGKKIKILEAEIKDDKLAILKVQQEGGKPMSFKDFLLGHKDFTKN